jgi:GNAT superfamily N-acetyltransferase
VTVLIDCKADPLAEPFRDSATELEPTALADLSRFLGSVFGGESTVWQDRFAHWWTLNPAWNASIPRGWLVRSNTEAITAFTANIPFRYVIDDKPALCCATGSTAVDPNFRGLGLAKAVGRKFLNQTHGELLVGTDSTAIAFGLWRSLGMKPLEERWQRCNLRVAADGRALGRIHWPSAPSARAVTRTAANGLALLLNSLELLSRRSKSLSIELIDGFSERDIDGIDACRASNAKTYARRDVDTLNWLYFGTQNLKRTRAVFVARSGARLVGYLAMKQWGGHSYYLLECRCRDADSEIARELIWAARDLARQNHARSILVRPYTWMIEAAVPAMVSVTVKKPMMTYCYKFRAGETNVGNWEAGPADGDVSVN